MDTLENCGKCQNPPCAICFPSDEKAKLLSDYSTAELERVRQENADNDVQAPTIRVGMVNSIKAPTTDNAQGETETIQFFDVRAAMEESASKTSPFIGKVEVAEPDIRYIPGPTSGPVFQKITQDDLLTPIEDTRPQPGEVIMVDSPADVLDFTGAIDGGGIKDSMKDEENKPRMALVPHALIWGCAKVLTYGAKKYAANNWRRGMRWGECADALLRHLFAWLEGEDVDPESGLSHLAHCSANLAFLMHMETNHEYALMDDRPQTRRYTEDG